MFIFMTSANALANERIVLVQKRTGACLQPRGTRIIRSVKPRQARARR